MISRLVHSRRGFAAPVPVIERDEDIIPQPGAEGNMPPAPEIAHRLGKIGAVEVFHQVDAQDAGGADGDIAVSRKIDVDLEAEGQHGHDHLGSFRNPAGSAKTVFATTASRSAITIFLNNPQVMRTRLLIKAL